MKVWVAKVHESIEHNDVFVSTSELRVERAAAEYILGLWNAWGIGHPPADGTALDALLDDFPLDLTCDIFEREVLE